MSACTCFKPRHYNSRCRAKEHWSLYRVLTGNVELWREDIYSAPGKGTQSVHLVASELQRKVSWVVGKHSRLYVDLPFPGERWVPSWEGDFLGRTGHYQGVDPFANHPSYTVIGVTHHKEEQPVTLEPWHSRFPGYALAGTLVTALEGTGNHGTVPIDWFVGDLERVG